MGAAPGWEDGELEFKLVFEEDPPAVPGSGAGNSNCESGTEKRISADETHSPDGDTDECPSPSFQEISPSTNQPMRTLHAKMGGMNCAANRAGMHSPPPRPALDKNFIGTYESQPARFIQLGGSRILECPSIQITTISPENHYSEENEPYSGWERMSRDHLYLPLDPFAYRDAGSLSPSPASSLSSRSWISEASSCESLQLLCDEDELNEATSRFSLGSPIASPRPSSPRLLSYLLPTSPSSRPTSPGGKRRYSSYSEGYSPLPSPSISRRGSFSEDPLSPDSLSDSSTAPDYGFPRISGGVESDNIPQKTRKTSIDQSARKEEPVIFNSNGYQPIGPADDGFLHIRKENNQNHHSGMDYLSVPSPLVWSKARISGHSPVFRSSALPPLDWPLPSQFDQYELRIEVQPRSHHRAHYETEGSRGAVKASPGGHPIVKLSGYNEKPLSLQMFIGTADERSLRPHAFYQVHRITGKMVGTASQEMVLAGTKVLEIPLHPENGMAANIDCAGILKLRNSDIELRKGETDIGRKNTRVKLVFRVHIPQGGGKVVSVQTASIPIECSQRSAQELPVVESGSITSCSVEGGEELVLTGANFLPESKIIFLEKGPDGKLQWEEEAVVNREKSSESKLYVQIPAYCDRNARRPIQVCFYVFNGKRKRSPTQCFRYLPAVFKGETSQEISMTGLLHSPVPDFNGTRGTPPVRLLDPGGFLSQIPPYPSNFHSFPTSYRGQDDQQTQASYPLTNLGHSPTPMGNFSTKKWQDSGDAYAEGTEPTTFESLPVPSGFETDSGIGLNDLLLPHLQKPSPSPTFTWLDTHYSSSSPSRTSSDHFIQDSTASHGSQPMPKSYSDSSFQLNTSKEVYESGNHTYSVSEPEQPMDEGSLYHTNSINPVHFLHSLTDYAPKPQDVSSIHPLHSQSNQEGHLPSYSPTSYNYTNSGMRLEIDNSPSSSNTNTETQIAPNSTRSSFPEKLEPGHFLSKGASAISVCNSMNLDSSAPHEGIDLPEEDLKTDMEGYHLPFQNIPMQGITLEEVNEFIGENLNSFPETSLESREL
ncbi:nuclear factor of activated T-cells, cytoplasmic 4 [Polypterus senegalus]|uniref:nuclear factor of activated T-cells, cytoplasmic 4 n=1 Tax=Polypterus senegalus TaxID=55291 RepID=UPI001962FF1D|nr:nuclear factor of activated T-cells, cytoplasmic 4 [Polypterus senegalus]